MKAKYRKFLIICGKALMLVCLAAFALLCVFYYASPKDEAQIIRTKAEETAPISENAIPVSSAHELTEWDTIDYEAQKLVIQSNTYVFTGKEYFAVWSNEKTYAYTAGVLNVNRGSVDQKEIKSNYFAYPVLSMTGSTELGCTSVYFRIPVEMYPEFSTVEKFKSWLSEKAADGKPLKVTYKTEAAYSVGLDYFYNAGKTDGHEEGYEEGYEAGKKDGYEEGFAAGYNDGYGKAVDVLATGLLTKGNSSYINKQLAPGGSGISCNAYSDYFTYSYAASYSGLLSLNCARSYSNGYKLKIKVESVTVETVFSAMLLDLETSSSAMYEVFRLPVVSSATTYEKIVNLPVSTTRSFKSFVITPASAPSGGTIKGLEIEVVGSEKDYYDNGYDNGYTEGKKFGYDSGYTKGYAMGKSDAMSQMSDSDLPSSVRSFVFSLFDAPVTSFLSAFNLSYDGFDLGSLVAFIFTAIVIVGVIRLVT